MEKNQGRRKHKLFPQEVMKRIPALYSQENVKDPIVQASYFCPYSTARWLVTEADMEERLMFGFVEVFPGCGELGYISMDELEETTLRGLIPAIERDCSFSPAPLSVVRERLGI